MTVADVSGILLEVHEGLSAVQQAGFDYYEPGSGDDKVCWAAKAIDGVTLVLFPGSQGFWDWIRDLDTFANPLDHSTLGPLHPGFFMGVPQSFAEIQAHTKPPYVLTGFSLGAARALDITGLMTVAGTPPLACVTFGSPKPGFQQLADIIAKVPQWSYRNGNAHYYDLITDYAILPPPEHYVHPGGPPIECTAGPSWVDVLEREAFAFHKMALYARATARILTEVN